jgi:hypothetical protein
MIVPQDSAFLGFHNEIRDSLNGDHLSIVKFESETDSRYRQVIGDLKGLIKLAKEKHNQVGITPERVDLVP